MEAETLEKKIAKLPENLKATVEHFVDALLGPENSKLARNGGKFKIQKGFGGGKGLIAYMADDFDAPMEDFKD